MRACQMGFSMRIVPLAVLAAAAFSLSGCIAYDAASAVVGVGATAVGAAGDVVGAAGDVVTSPFDKDDSDAKKAR
jgi:hypothetical protein